jgi:hypothetical protein
MYTLEVGGNRDTQVNAQKVVRFKKDHEIIDEAFLSEVPQSEDDSNSNASNTSSSEFSSDGEYAASSCADDEDSQEPSSDESQSESSSLSTGLSESSSDSVSSCPLSTSTEGNIASGGGDNDVYLSLEKDFYKSGAAALTLTKHFKTGETITTFLVGNPSPKSLNPSNLSNPKKYSQTIEKNGIKTTVYMIGGQTYVVRSDKKFSISEMVDGVFQGNGGPSSEYHVGTSNNDTLLQFQGVDCKGVLSIVSKEDLLVIQSASDKSNVRTMVQSAGEVESALQVTTEEFAQKLLSLIFYVGFGNTEENLLSCTNVKPFARKMAKEKPTFTLVRPDPKNCNQLRVFGKDMVERARNSKSHLFTLHWLQVETT